MAKKKKINGLVRDSNPGPLAPKARIMPLDQQATSDSVGVNNEYKATRTHWKGVDFSY